MITEEWFCGFVDGEGCFRLQTYTGRTGPNAGRRMKMIQFDINQHSRDRQVIDAIHRFFGFGSCYASGRLTQWRVQRQTDLEHLVDLFTRHPLQTAKREDFEIWKQAVALRFLAGGSAIGDRNAEAWARFEALEQELKALRQSRRAWVVS